MKNKITPLKPVDIIQAGDLYVENDKPSDDPKWSIVDSGHIGKQTKEFPSLYIARVTQTAETLQAMYILQQAIRSIVDEDYTSAAISIDYAAAIVSEYLV